VVSQPKVRRYRARQKRTGSFERSTCWLRILGPLISIVQSTVTRILSFREPALKYASLEIHAARKRPLQSRRQTSISSPIIEAPSAAESAVEGVPIPQTFPPPPNPSGNYPTMSSSPTSAASRAASNALSRALSLASKRLFGPTTSRPSPPTPIREQPHSSPRRRPLTPLAGEMVDPVEDTLLSELEGRAQKTEVLTHWADELYEYVKAVPQSKSWS
jgi:serine/threonine-protein kinase ULK/ATG1